MSTGWGQQQCWQVKENLELYIINRPPPRVQVLAPLHHIPQ
jgi:hypothetical protein